MPPLDSSKNIDVQTEGNICLIGINRPHVKNAVDPQTAKELQAAFCHFEEDPNLNVAIFYGKGELSEMIVSIVD